IIVLGGFGTWLIGRRGTHIGASGVIMGYWAYLLFYAYQYPTAVSVALAAVCLYYFGGLFLNLFPTQVKSSWEAHLCGFLAGLAAAYIYVS
ncbi:MAG TPA: rhomboid family intramembrane serine protease, partial [Gammaproteobacteria bacterium]|nr:rhomboid family intramembrane serine protease [Gammaproteobacteria bacterium]